MGSRGKRAPSPLWKRVEIVMQVQLGQKTVRDAARELGIHVSTMFRKLKALHIELPDRDGRDQPDPEEPGS